MVTWSVLDFTAVCSVSAAELWLCEVFEQTLLSNSLPPHRPSPLRTLGKFSHHLHTDFHSLAQLFTLWFYHSGGKRMLEDDQENTVWWTSSPICKSVKSSFKAELHILYTLDEPWGIGLVQSIENGSENVKSKEKKTTVNANRLIIMQRMHWWCNVRSLSFRFPASAVRTNSLVGVSVFWG